MEAEARREVEDGGVRFARRLPFAKAQHFRLAGAGLDIEAGGGGEYVDVEPAHLDQPRRGHDGAHALRVDEHYARVAHADVLVGRLTELAAGRMARAGDVAGLEFLARANVEEIGGALLFAQPRLHAPGIGELHAEALRDLLGRGLRLG